MKKEKKSSEVTVFGEVVSNNNNKKNTEANITSGFALIFVGLILLFNYMEILPWEIWQEIVQFWPLLLILMGLRILLGEGWVANFLMTIINIGIFGWLITSIIYKFAPELIDWIPQDIINLILIWERRKI